MYQFIKLSVKPMSRSSSFRKKEQKWEVCPVCGKPFVTIKNGGYEVNQLMLPAYGGGASRIHYSCGCAVLDGAELLPRVQYPKEKETEKVTISFQTDRETALLIWLGLDGCAVTVKPMKDENAKVTIDTCGNLSGIDKCMTANMLTAKGVRAVTCGRIRSFPADVLFDLTPVKEWRDLLVKEK